MIPFVDLKAQYRSIKEEIDCAVGRLLESAEFVLGSEVDAFEEEFARYWGARYGVALNSGTSALHLALLAEGVGSGDEVVTVPFTFVATVAAILYTGARPVFVDIDPRTLTMSPGDLEAAITPRTKAILPVHLHGHPADMDPIMACAHRHDIAVIEDAAQAHGAKYKNRPVGSLGNLACFSFYPGKNLGAYGEGGMVVTDKPAIAERIRMLRDWGQSRRHHHEVLGFNYRMDGIQGAILRVKLHHLEQWTEARRANADTYTRLLAGTCVSTPVVAPDVRHVYHIYAVRSAFRDQLNLSLTEAGVQTGFHYPIPVHLQQAYRDPRYRQGDFPHSERAASEVLSLPMYPELTHRQIEFISERIRGFSMATPSQAAGTTA